MGFQRAGNKKTFFGGVVFGVSALDLTGPLQYALTLAPCWGSTHKKFMRNFFGHAGNIFAVGEQLPRNNSITIDPDVKDDFGIPVARISTRLHTNDLEMLSFMDKKCREIADSAGAIDILRATSSYDLSSISHMGGTCRMGEDPNRSVVNAFCQSHEVNNLFVIDSSCLVTEGAGDSPSLTIHALALRESDYIKEEARKSGYS